MPTEIHKLPQQSREFKPEKKTTKINAPKLLLINLIKITQNRIKERELKMKKKKKKEGITEKHSRKKLRSLRRDVIYKIEGKLEILESKHV